MPIKSKHIWISATGLIIFAFLLSQDFLARLAWQKYYNPRIALDLISQDADLAIRLGNYYFNGGAYDLTKATKAYKKALKAKPGILWGHYQLARIYFVKGENNPALEEINKELEANPENLRALYVRGLIYGYRGFSGDLELAENDFRRFVSWAPSEWAGYNDLAWILERLRDYKEAELVIEQAFEKIAGADENPWLWNSLGVARLNLKEYELAASAFTKALELANLLTPEKWQKSYPGNGPQFAESGLSSFRQAIEENLKRSMGGEF